MFFRVCACRQFRLLFQGETISCSVNMAFDDHGFFLTCEDFGGRSDDLFPPSALFLFSFFIGDHLTHTSSTFLSARISPQWLSELRLWSNVPI